MNRVEGKRKGNEENGKDLSELRATSDSVGGRVDSVGAIYAGELRRQPIVGTSAYKSSYDGKKYTYTMDDGS